MQFLNPYYVFVESSTVAKQNIFCSEEKGKVKENQKRGKKEKNCLNQ